MRKRLTQGVSFEMGLLAPFPAGCHRAHGREETFTPSRKSASPLASTLARASLVPALEIHPGAEKDGHAPG
jgi:hypothetical protein